MSVTLHPVADEATDQYLVYAATARSVLLTEPLRVFCQAATTDGLRPVLVTHADARLSPVTHVALAQAGGFWVVHTPDGVFETRTGHQLDSFTQLWAAPTIAGPVLAGYTGEVDPGTAILAFDVYTQTRAEPTTQIGADANRMVTGLGGHPLTRWGLAEPFLTGWDPDQITVFARTHMPRTPPAWAGAPDGSFTQTTVGRARHGLVEHTTGAVPAGAWPTRPTDLTPVAVHALTDLATATTVTLGLVWATARNPDATLSAVPRPPDQPLAVLIGARTVHDLDLTDLAARHHVTTLGRARTPSVLVTFSDPDTDLWVQLLRLAADLGPTRITHAAGWDHPDAP